MYENEEDRKLGEKRFEFKADEIEITFIPKCNTCDLNINSISCEKFGNKPVMYMNNRKDCPYKKLVE